MVRFQNDNSKTDCLTALTVKSVRFVVKRQEHDRVVRIDSFSESTFSHVFVLHGELKPTITTGRI